MKLVWREFGREFNKQYELLINGRGRSRATVYHYGLRATWHTWDSSGCGGENASEDTVEEAKRQALASAILQGFIRGIEVTNE